MLEYARFKYVIIAVVVLLSVIYALPNLYPQDPSIQITANRGYEVDAALEKRVEGALAKAGVETKSVGIEDEDELLVRLQDVQAQTVASDVLNDVIGEHYVVALNLAPTAPDWLDSIGARRMLMGLDLQGGVHFLMQVDRKAALDKRFDAYAEDVRVLLRDNRIRYESVERRGAGEIVARLAPGADASKALGLVARDLPNLRTDVEGDNNVVIRVPDSEIQQMVTDAVEQNIGTLRNRINELGVAEPLIQRQGAERVVVQLPGVQDTAQAKRILGATATLEYRGVVEGDAYEALRTGNVPPNARIYYRKEIGPDGKPIPILLNKRVIATGDQLVTARSGYDPRSGTHEHTGPGGHGGHGLGSGFDLLRVVGIDVQLDALEGVDRGWSVRAGGGGHPRRRAPTRIWHHEHTRATSPTEKTTPVGGDGGRPRVGSGGVEPNRLGDRGGRNHRGLSGRSLIGGYDRLGDGTGTSGPTMSIPTNVNPSRNTSMPQSRLTVEYPA